MTDYLTILDISRYQGELNVAKAKAEGVVGVKIRATVGNYYTDPMFALNRQRCIDGGMMWGGYHVHRPDNTPSSQINRFMNVIGARTPDIPHTIDVEVHADLPNYAITSNLYTVMSLTPAVRNKLPEIYTRAGYWNYRINTSPVWARYPLHVANYTTAASPVMPRDWAEWLLWQWSADGNYQGAKYGVESISVDLNRFAGDYNAWRAACGFNDTFPVPALPEPVYPRIAHVVSPVTLRAAASTASASYGLIPSGIEIRVHGTKQVGADEWARLGAGQLGWCAVTYRGKKYLEWVT